MGNYHCSNCREKLSADATKRVSIGSDRNVVFCGNCNCYVALEEPVVAPKVVPAKQPE